jgi:hypothetical protein
VSYKPADFFVSITDFFSILLPGSLLAFLGHDFADTYIFGPLVPTLETTAEKWVTFAFASYLLGQFMYMVSSTFMDKLYNVTFLPLVKKWRNDAIYNEARAKQGTYYSNLVGTLKWTAAFVRRECSVLGEQLDRFEATSKFFRSLTIVFAIFALVYFLRSLWVPTMACVLLSFLSFARYADQRWKFVELACICYVQININKAVAENKADVDKALAAAAGRQ